MTDPRLLLYERYKDLVCVAPPGVPISPTSKLAPSDLGKRPAKMGERGWYGYGWVKDQPTGEDVERWVTWNANVGLRGTRYPAVDIDCTDPGLSDKIRALTLLHLGPAPGRGRGDSPKQLLVYRTAEPFSRVAVEIKNGEGQTHLVEVLAHGRQYLVYGTHPSGSAYRWIKTPLWEVRPEQLTEISATKVEEYLQQLSAELVAAGYSVTRVGRAHATIGEAPPQQELLAPSLEALHDAVRAIPNESPDRDDYVMFGCAVKAAAGVEWEEEGYSAFFWWASAWTGGVNDPETVRSDWRRMYPPFRVGYEWLMDRAKPFGFSTVPYEFTADPEATPPAEVYDPDLPMPVELTHDWLAEQLIPDLRDVLRYDYANARWHIWDGHSWAHDTTGRHQRETVYALRFLAVRLRERVAGLDVKQQSKWHKKISTLGDRMTISAVSTMLAAHPELVVDVDTFDQEAMQLNTPGGIVDLNTGELLPHDPEAMHSKSTSVAPGEDCPRWMQFLDEVTQNDQDLIDYMQKVCGYALTGLRREQILQFVWGPGGNGKSVFVDTIMDVMGDYAATAPMDTFASTKGDRHSTDLAGLMGARLVTATETQAGRSWDEQRIKSITGGDRMRARFMHQNFVEFQPQFKLLFVGNNEPQIDTVDEAMRRRIHMIPFTFQPKHPDLRLTDVLRTERPGILSWMIRGCLKWQTEGLVPPEVVKLRTEEYFEEENLLERWFLERCDVDPAATMVSSAAYRSWNPWVTARGEKVGTQREFTKQMRALAVKYGFKKALVRSERLAGWVGVRLTEEEVVFDIKRSLT